METKTFKKVNFILGIVFCLLFSIFAINSIVILLLHITIPKTVETIFPRHKFSQDVMIFLSENVELFPTFSQVFLIASILLFISLILLIFVSNLKFNKLLLIVFPINLILLVIAVICTYLTVGKINSYYFSVFGFYVYGLFLVNVHLILLIFIPLAGLYISTFITMSDLDFKVKSKVNIITAAITIAMIAFPFIAINYLSKDQELTINDIKGLDYESQLPDKKYLIAKSNGTILTKALSGSYSYSKTISLPLSKHNADILIKQNKKKFYLKASSPMQTFLRHYYTYNFDFKAFDKLLAEEIKRYPQHSLFNFALLIASVMGRINVDKEALITAESMYKKKSYSFTDEGNCIWGLLIYKQGGSISSKFNFLNQGDSNICTMIETGEIKKTTFNGSIRKNNNPLKTVPVALIVVNENNNDYDKFQYTSLVDFTYTDAKGNFTLKAETYRNLGLVVFNDKIKNIKFDYSKLLNYKQGGIINLGKIVLE